MIKKGSLNPIKVLALGAINGLLVGSALEKARITLLNYQMSRAAREDAQLGLLSDYIEKRWEPFIPLVFIPVFAIVAYFVYQYFKSRPTLLLSLWFGLGTVAIGAGYYISASNLDVFSFVWCFSLVAVCYLVYRLWKRHPDSIALLWVVIGISAVVVIAFVAQLLERTSLSLWSLFLFGVVSINTIYGAVMQLLFRRHDRDLLPKGIA
jgi:hypothetical protein